MKDCKLSNKKDQMKFNKFILSNKNNEEEKNKKSIKKEREKEKVKKEKKNISKNQAFINEKNGQSKDLFINNICKNEKILVNQEIKEQKSYEKNCSSDTELIRLQKKKKSIILF